jgi:hypothetical protein
MADRNDRDVMAQDLELDEKQSEEVTGGANVALEEVSLVSERRVIDQLPPSVKLP